MKAIVNTAPGELSWQELPLPEPRAGQVRIRTGACGICATDVLMVAGWERTGFPAVPGHEWAGTIDAVGPDGDARLVGQRCVAENVLEDGLEVGFEHPGGYGQYLLTEAANLQLLPADYPLRAAALIEPLAVVVRALRRLRLEDPRSVLVLGDGPIGLLCVMLLKKAGAEQVVLLGGRRSRLALGQELGASAALDYRSLAGQPAGNLLERFGPFANVIEASGAEPALETALAVVKRTGKVLIVGDYGPARAHFPWGQLLHQEWQLIGSNASADAWPEAVRLAAEENLPLERLVSHRYKAQDFATGFEKTRQHVEDVIKIVLEWE